jgi:LysM repeat protein
MKLGPLKFNYSGIGYTVAGFTALGIIGGAAAAQHPPVQTITVQEKPSGTPTLTADRTTLDVAAVTGGNYVVRSGDTLAGIAGREYGSAGCWPGIYAANAGRIANPNMIYVGQTLSIPGACSTHGPTTVTAAVSKPAPTARAQTEDVGYSVDSSFEACVIRTESGGDADIWNASGHWGLFQFSEATWIAYGGAASEFGHASAAEQTVVFDNAMARGGESNWAPYDGC